MLSGTRANIAVKVFGDDLGTLRRLGERVRSVMAGVPGVADLSLEQQMDVPFVRFVLNRSAIARYGLHADDVAAAVETSFAGATVGRIFDRGTAFDLVVKFDAASNADFERIADLPVDTPAGGPVPVRLLADVRREEGPNMILRENVQRRIVISSNVAGRDLGSVVDDIRSAVAQAVPMPAGYRVEYGGQFESQQSASRRLLVLSIGVVAALFMLGSSWCSDARDGWCFVTVNLRSRSSAAWPASSLPSGGAERRTMTAHHALRHRDAQRHHARLARPPPAMGEEGVASREASSGGPRAPRSHLDDGHGGRPGPCSARARRRQDRQRDPDADGDRDPVRARDIDVLNMAFVPTLYLRGVQARGGPLLTRPDSHHIKVF